MAQRITQPSTEPVTLADVKAQLNIKDTTQDAVITRRIKEAREYIEEYLQRSLMLASWRVILDEFPPEIELPYAPVSAIISVKYVDTSGVQHTMSNTEYVLDNYSEPAWLVPYYGTSWPATLDAYNVVEVVYSAGYASADEVPQPIKEAIMLLVGHWMNFQGNIESGSVITRVPLAVEQLVFPWKVIKL